MARIRPSSAKSLLPGLGPAQSSCSAGRLVDAGQYDEAARVLRARLERARTQEWKAKAAVVATQFAWRSLPATASAPPLAEETVAIARAVDDLWSERLGLAMQGAGAARVRRDRTSTTGFDDSLTVAKRTASATDAPS